eukprot:gnl/MRDRNA2_/MRDRNA2_85707_c0_seq2.p1 gnl/MRDRNA2_/MRDRNA2_85707_c0~~gnl/MRDRNA2_/MRDRNA2_85707_c0_seq2.p1  ORF type:complete len:787 (+),score=142.50 gnl/MRDRNA2_/MRDRNA2_85707_c0_seq2:26-2362(+)
MTPYIPIYAWGYFSFRGLEFLITHKDHKCVFSALSWFIWLPFLVLVSLDYWRGLAVRVPFSSRVVPFEGIAGVIAVLKMEFFVRFIMEALINKDKQLVTGTGIDAFFFNPACYAQILIFSCPLLFEVGTFTTWVGGGRLFEAFLFSVVSRLPWATSEKKMLVLSRTGNSQGMQRVVSTVPLQEGYDSINSSRLKVLLSDFGKAAFVKSSVEYLIVRRADPNVVNEHNHSVLVHAALCDNVEVVRYLVGLPKVRQNIDLADGKQQTALHYAKSSEAARLLLAAGADASLANHDGYTAFMLANNEVQRELSEPPWGIDWSVVEAHLQESEHLIPPAARLCDLLWSPHLSADEQQKRLDTVVSRCILPLVEINSSKGLRSLQKDSLAKALESTKCPRFRVHELSFEMKHYRGSTYDTALKEAMNTFKSQLEEARESLRSNPDEAITSMLFIPPVAERLHADYKWLKEWREDAWLSQLVAELIPNWLIKRNLCGALEALVSVEAIHSASEFSDLLRGQHPWFQGVAFLHYFQDPKEDVFWLALFVLYDLGKTTLISNDFQKAVQLAMDLPKDSTFVAAPVKGFKRIMEKLLQYCTYLEDKSFEKKIQCAAEVVDKARNSITCNTGEQLCSMVSQFAELEGKEVFVRPGVQVRLTSIQRKSTFEKPAGGGWADFKYWTLVEEVFHDTGTDEPRVGYALVAETQLILSSYLVVKKRMHMVYGAVRGDYDWSEEQIKLVKASSSHLSKLTLPAQSMKVVPVDDEGNAVNAAAVVPEPVNVRPKAA